MPKRYAFLYQRITNSRRAGSCLRSARIYAASALLLQCSPIETLLSDRTFSSSAQSCVPIEEGPRALPGLRHVDSRKGLGAVRFQQSRVHQPKQSAPCFGGQVCLKASQAADTPRLLKVFPARAPGAIDNPAITLKRNFKPKGVVRVLHLGILRNAVDIEHRAGTQRGKPVCRRGS
jgi:hypothetical protein